MSVIDIHKELQKQLPSSPNLPVFRSNTREYFDRADRQPVTIIRNNKMYILLSHHLYVQVVNAHRGARAIHTVVTIHSKTG